MELLERAAAAAPHAPAIWCDLGLAYKAAGRLAEAVACQRRVVVCLPDSPMALSNLGTALVAAGQAAEALPHLSRAAALAPADAEIAYNFGNALLACGRPDEAEPALRQALALDPTHARALMNLGVALKEQGRLAEAIDALASAAAAVPGWTEAEWNLSLALLMAGRWAEGFAAYEARRRLPGFAMHRPEVRPWTGGRLDGRTLLVHAEQGLGDTIQFCRWLARLEDLDGEIVFQAPEALLPLLRSLRSRARLARPDEPIAADLEVPLMSLPYLTASCEPFWPEHGAYLAPDAVRLARWRREIATEGKRVIAIHWQGNPNFRGDALRSIPLAAFAPLAEIDGVRLVSLQRNAGREQIAAVAWGARLRDLGPLLDQDGAFVDSVAVSCAADIVVTSDTGLAHAAAAAGARVWLALRDVPDWRWGLHGETTPWYPSMRLFRQDRPRDWDGVFARITRAVAQDLA